MPRESQSFLRRILRFRLLFVVNAVVLVFLSLSFGREFLRNHEIQSDIASLQSQADSLAARNLQIAELHTALQSESFIEREARLKLGLKKPGERVVVIRNPEVNTGEGNKTSGEQGNANPMQTLEQEAAERQSLANSTKWWYYFFDHDQFEQLSTYGN